MEGQPGGTERRYAPMEHTAKWISALDFQGEEGKEREPAPGPSDGSSQQAHDNTRRYHHHQEQINALERSTGSPAGTRQRSRHRSSTAGSARPLMAGVQPQSNERPHPGTNDGHRERQRPGAPL